MDSIFELIVVIGVDIPVVNRGQSIPPLHNLRDGPAGLLHSPCFFCGPILGDVFGGLISNPTVCNGDCRIIHNGVVAMKIQCQKKGNRFTRILGQVDEKVDGICLAAGVKYHFNLPTYGVGNRRAIVGFGQDDLIISSHCHGRFLPEHVFFKQRNDFCSANLFPLFCGGYRLTLLSH